MRAPSSPSKVLRVAGHASWARLAWPWLTSQSGPIDTELSPADGPMAETLKKLNSVGRRFGKSQEIAEAVAFLANPKSAFINGESPTVDGGWNA